MISWLHRAAQTRTPVHDQQENKLERESGTRLARNVLATILLLVQMLFWVIFRAYDTARQSTWQSTLLLALPLALQCVIWRSGQGAAKSRAKNFLVLPLTLCLMLDYYLMLLSCGALMSNMIPSFPEWTRLVVVSLFPVLTALSCGEKGLIYGAYSLRTLLMILFVLSTVLSLADVRVDRLWPLMGDGLANTAKAMLTGVGCTWVVSLFFIQPQTAPNKTSHPGPTMFIWLCLGLSLIWAVWMGMVSPWRSEDISMFGAKLTSISQYSSSVALAEMGSLFWLLMLPLGLAGSLSFGSSILNRAFTGLHRPLGAVVVALPGTVFMILSPTKIIPFVEAMMPWRYLISILVGIGFIIISKREGRS